MIMVIAGHRCQEDLERKRQVYLSVDKVIADMVAENIITQAHIYLHITQIYCEFFKIGCTFCTFQIRKMSKEQPKIWLRLILGFVF